MAAPSDDKTDTPVVNNPNEAESSEASREASSEAVSAPTPEARAKPERERPTPEPAGEAPANPPEPDPAELKDRLLRILADQENFRRRIERERDEAIRFAATQLVKDLLQTADNLARALQSVPSELPVENQALQNLLTGVAARERALQDTFARHGIRHIQPALGESFDPNQHHAMFEVALDDYEPGAIAEIVLPGYAYHERLLRPAFVAIAKPERGTDRPD
jgi:molecular chaperone GrpE